MLEQEKFCVTHTERTGFAEAIRLIVAIGLQLFKHSPGTFDRGSCRTIMWCIGPAGGSRFLPLAKAAPTQRSAEAQRYSAMASSDSSGRFRRFS